MVFSNNWVTFPPIFSSFPFILLVSINSPSNTQLKNGLPITFCPFIRAHFSLHCNFFMYPLFLPSTMNKTGIVTTNFYTALYSLQTDRFLARWFFRSTIVSYTALTSHLWNYWMTVIWVPLWPNSKDSLSNPPRAHLHQRKQGFFGFVCVCVCVCVCVLKFSCQSKYSKDWK